jgi:hypothetical protein
VNQRARRRWRRSRSHGDAAAVEAETRLGGIVKTTLLIATALATLMTDGAHAQDYSSILRSLPGDVQEKIEAVRSGCQEQLKDIDLSSPRQGLTLFSLSGAQAVMVNYLDVCGGNEVKYVNCSTWGSYYVAIYVRSGTVWREVLLEPVVNVFLSIDEDNNKFKAAVLRIRKDKVTPNRDVVVKWNGTKFTYKPL